MSELTVREETAAAVPEQPTAPVSALAQWAFDADQAFQIATKLAGTSFVPASMRGKAGDVTAAILTGAELGFRPMASLRAMDVIQGTPALRAHAMRGLVQSHGHAVQLVESGEALCVMRGRRKGETEWQTVTWTIERAERLGLTGKSEWQKQPTTMLIARATGEICRLIASDVLYAAPYAAEELGDSGVPVPSVSAAPVSAGEILAAEPDGQDDGAVEDPGDRFPPDDPDGAAREELLAEETGGWPAVRRPGSGV